MLFRSIYAHDRLIGGCIWEWADHAILVQDKGGKPYYAYGGDFGEEMHDGNFCMDGLVFPDRKPSPGLFEIKAVYQGIDFKDFDYKNGWLTIKNRYDFINLNNFFLKYSLQVDGRTICQNVLSPDLEPHGNSNIRIDLPIIETCYFGVYLNVEAVLKKDALWEKAGFCVAQAQFCLPVTAALKRKPVIPIDHIQLEQNNCIIKVRGDTFSYTFSKIYGNFESIVSSGAELLAAPVSIGVYRTPTDNDRYIKEQ